MLDCALDLADPEVLGSKDLSNAIWHRAKGPQEKGMRPFLPYRCAGKLLVARRGSSAAQTCLSIADSPLLSLTAAVPGHSLLSLSSGPPWSSVASAGMHELSWQDHCEIEG